MSLSKTTPSLRTPEDHRTQALNRVLALLIRGISLRFFCCDDREFEEFQRKLRTLREDIARIDDDDSGMVVVGSGPRLIDTSGECDADPRTAGRRKELDAAISMISESLLSAARSGQERENELRESEQAMVVARTSGELAAAAIRLTVVLESIRAGVLRRNDATLMPSQHYAAADIDLVTGLPNTRPAMEALSSAWKHRKRYCAAIFGVQRLNAINARFGFQAGDDALRIVTQHLAESFARDYLLFRWRGPCLLCVMEKRMPEPLIVADVKRVASVRLQQSMAMKNREAIVSISISWSMIPLEADDVEGVVSRLEDFMFSGMNGD